MLQVEMELSTSPCFPVEFDANPAIQNDTEVRPDKTAYDQATKAELKPVKLTNTLAFMFETRFPQHLTRFAAELETLQEDYADCWTGLERQFRP